MPASKNATLMKACAKYILGESTGIRLKGRAETLETLQEVLNASRDLYSALQRKRPLREIQDLLDRKRRAAEKFKDVTGLMWRL